MNNKMVQSSSVMFNDSLMSTDDALTLLFDSAIVSTQTEISSLDSSIGRILAKDIHSKINVPGFDNSSMDGYTIALDENNTSMTNQSFDVVDRITAGSTGNELKRG
ncbi:MAG: molybdopterin molybdenumtransferase MoeA, partial [Thiotrichales bacterium]|nr:molybdopterin molybdenumtransferase MoeA [Thiotrichales bacterium]